MKHQLTITLRKPGEQQISVAEFKKLSWFEKLSSRWFGSVQKVMVLIPEDSVQTLEIKEVATNEKSKDIKIDAR